MKNLLIVATIFILAGAGYYYYQNYNGNEPSKITECPDEKIINRMPGTSPESSYYIKNGERKEISDYDSNLVQNNCNVPSQVVY